MDRQALPHRSPVACVENGAFGPHFAPVHPDKQSSGSESAVEGTDLGESLPASALDDEARSDRGRCVRTIEDDNLMAAIGKQGCSRKTAGPAPTMAI